MNVAFIPVRGGSKSIPLKNIKDINGKPLVYWTIIAACCCDFIEKVYVSTDSDKIRETVENLKNYMDEELFRKVKVINRSYESATDTAPTEVSMLEFASNYDFENIVLIQATSPLLSCDDLNNGFKAFLENDVDSVLSVVRQKRFIWEKDCDGNYIATNYDFNNRPRRQEFDGYLVENGAFYITSKINLIKNKNRISGRIKTVEMREESIYEIDEPSDWVIIESLMKREDSFIKNKISEIKMFLTDCDGCLTDNGMYYSEFGDELKKFNTRDGMGFQLLNEKGIITGIVTSEEVNLNKKRAKKLKLDILKQGCKNKAKVVKELCKEFGIKPESVCYVGDDINDIDVIKMVGLGCCPANAMPQVKAVSKYIAKASGGEGVIREIVEKIILGGYSE